MGRYLTEDEREFLSLVQQLSERERGILIGIAQNMVETKQEADRAEQEAHRRREQIVVTVCNKQ